MKVFLKTWCLTLFICAESTLSMTTTDFEEQKDRTIKSEINRKNVEHFECKFQKLEEIPAFMSAENIDFSYNRIKDFEEIIQQKNLRQLILSHNLIMNIPKEIKELKNLVQLNLSHNIIFEIPLEIGMLENLELLNLSYNQLRNIPSIWGNLSNLSRLNLAHNFIKNLPEELWNLKNLKFLGLSENRLDNISASIEKLENLKILDIEKNDLFNLPKEIDNLKNLKEIYLDEGFSIKKFTNEDNPQILNLNNKKLPYIPFDIIMLRKSLKELHLRNNKLSDIPPSLGKLKKLKKLNLSKNPINSTDDVPVEILELSNLKTLILSVKQSEIPSIEANQNEEGKWVVKYKNKREKKSKKVIGVEKNGDLVIEYSKKGIEEIRQKRIHKLNSKTNDILINYLFVYNNETPLSDEFLRKQVAKDQDFLNVLYQKENKLQMASNRFRFNKIKVNHHEIDYSETDDLSRLNASRNIRNERHSPFAQ